MGKKECPECGKPVEPGDEACAECGAELAKPKAAGPRKPLPDGAKVGIIIGCIVVGIIVLIVLASGMTSTFKCEECKGKGTWTCQNCKGGTIEPKCTACKGTGQDRATFSTCAVCEGRRTVKLCPKCKGESTGKCKTCGGTGETPR